MLEQRLRRFEIRVPEHLLDLFDAPLLSEEAAEQRGRARVTKVVPHEVPLHAGALQHRLVPSRLCALRHRQKAVEVALRSRMPHGAPRSPRNMGVLSSGLPTPSTVSSNMPTG
jgi:hypothetical protein